MEEELTSDHTDIDQTALLAHLRAERFARSIMAQAQHAGLDRVATAMAFLGEAVASLFVIDIESARSLAQSLVQGMINGARAAAAAKPAESTVQDNVRPVCAENQIRQYGW
jgi:hypothetical protein